MLDALEMIGANTIDLKTSFFGVFPVAAAKMSSHLGTLLYRVTHAMDYYDTPSPRSSPRAEPAFPRLGDTVSS